MKELTIDGKMMTSKSEIYTHLGRVFSLPLHFGNNLDALWDVLTEVNEPTIIHFENIEEVIGNLDAYGEKVIQLFQDLEGKQENYTGHFYPDEIIEED